MKNYLFILLITLAFTESIYAGNTCGTATPIPVFNETCVPDIFVAFTATPSNMGSSCAINSNPDWFLEFVADNTEATIEFGDLIFGLGGIVVYEECGAEIYCESALTPFSSHELSNLIIGASYQIRIVMPPGLPFEGFICVHSPDCISENWYADDDNDNYGDPNDIIVDCFQPMGYVSDNTDCDDTDPDVNPGATEICNGIDDDCDSLIDDADPSVTGQLTWYADFDFDTYGDPDNFVLACDEPSGANFVLDNTDCDDTDPDVNPGATEICNGIDDDCDSLIDDQDPDVTGQITWYADNDGDDYGDPGFSVDACIPPNDDFVTDNTDCDDSNPNINPGSSEVCNGIDDDCDNLIDDQDPDVVGQTIWYADFDFDNYGDPLSSIISCEQPAGYIEDDTDCDDNNPDINPGATEICNGIDDNCDNLIDDDDPDVVGQTTWYADFDFDTYGDPNIAILSCQQPVDYVANFSDCDDSDPNINPGATEICNEIDDNCNNLIDDDDPNVVGQTTWYADFDFDTYGDPLNSILSCNQPVDFVLDFSDCDDTNPDINPGATEVCNGVDDNCDDLIDSQDPNVTDQVIWYADLDSDNYGDPLNTILSCDQPVNFVLDFSDCDDTNPNINPGATEVCNGIDDNCDNLIDDDDPDVVGQTTWYADFDNDTYGDPLTSMLSCNQPVDYVEDFSDCDDSNPDINPGATEICNDLDDNCNDLVDENAITDVTITVSGLTLTAIVTGGTAPYSYNWSTGETTESITLTQPDDTWVIVTDAYNCMDSVSYIFTGTNEVNDIVLRMYPIPAKNILQLDFPEDIHQLEFIEVIDITGKRIFSRQNVNSSTLERIDLSNEDPGYYILHLINDGRFQILKFILLKE